MGLSSGRLIDELLSLLLRFDALIGGFDMTTSVPAAALGRVSDVASGGGRGEIPPLAASDAEGRGDDDRNVPNVGGETGAGSERVPKSLRPDVITPPFKSGFHVGGEDFASCASSSLERRLEDTFTRRSRRRVPPIDS